MADPATWSRLPHIFLPLIIEHTDDETFKAWCDATATSSYFHRTAMRKKYRDFTISRKDLISPPTRITRNRREPVQQASSAIDYQRIASFVQNLSLGFPNVTIRTFFQGTILARGLTRDITHTLQSILPWASNLERIEHHGLLHQEHLNQILKLRGLKVLRARKTLDMTDDDDYIDPLAY